MDESCSNEKMVEIRLFGALKKYGDEKGWSFPHFFPLESECSAVELAEVLEIPLDQVEGVFINGFAQPFEGARIKPGERIGFIPYGVPGPYRLMLGLKKKS